MKNRKGKLQERVSEFFEENKGLKIGGIVILSVLGIYSYW